MRSFVVVGGGDVDQKRESELDRFVDDAFGGSRSPVAAVAKGLLKGVGGMVSQAFEGMREDVDDVSTLVERALMLDVEASRLLGSGIRCGAPFSQMSSSSSFNGQTTKSVSLQMPVQGSAGQGTVAVQARSKADGSMAIDQLTLATSDGRQMQVDVSGRGDDGDVTGGGPPPEGGRGGPGASKPSSGEVVDVEIL